MTCGLPTWQLVLNAASRLDAGEGREFSLQSLIAAVRGGHPERQRGSISPVVQGMTANAPGGPRSPCGTPLRRTGHGRYVLIGGERRDVAAARPHRARPLARATPRVLPARLTEDEVKRAVADHLESLGWTVTVAWARERGVDIDARRGQERLLLEAKAAAALPPQQVNYFLGAIGELVQRMDDRAARYGLALPDNPQYRGLVDRLPGLARERVQLVFLVRRSDAGFDVTHV